MARGHAPLLNSSNHDTYTVESPAITLIATEKANDVFVRWTGSNSDESQPIVTIPTVSTGERLYFANYLRSGASYRMPSSDDEADKLWAAKDELYIRTSKPDAIVRVYSPEGVLQRQQIIVKSGETKIKLPTGLYIVTLNYVAGQIVRING